MIVVEKILAGLFLAWCLCAAYCWALTVFERLDRIQQRRRGR